MYRDLERRAKREIHSMGYPSEIVGTLERFLTQAEYHWKQSRDMKLPLQQRSIARDRAMKNLFFVLDFVTFNRQHRFESCTLMTKP